MFFRVSELKKHFDSMQKQLASNSALAVPDASSMTLATEIDAAGGSAGGALPSLYLCDGMDMVQRFVRDDDSDFAGQLVKIPHGGGKFVLLDEVSAMDWMHIANKMCSGAGHAARGCAV
jgi:hypothetical protein